jgi:hypothetical protein
MNSTEILASINAAYIIFGLVGIAFAILYLATKQNPQKV